MNKRSKAWIWVVVTLVVIIAAATLWLYQARRQTPPASMQARPPQAASTAPATPAIRHPISQARSTPAAAASAAVPLDGSDVAIRKGLGTLTDSATLDHLLVSHDLIQHIVATVDALPRRTVDPNLLPVHSPRGSFATARVDGHTVISDRNARRYAPYMKLIETVDATAAVNWYVHHYPLFQAAYRQLGYPKGYFNDRVVKVIDQLLATPDAKPPVALQRPNVFYTFADPKLESLSAGQKMLLRAGPADEARIKAKLRAIRAALVGRTLPATAGSAAAAAH